MKTKLQVLLMFVSLLSITKAIGLNTTEATLKNNVFKADLQDNNDLVTVNILSPFSASAAINSGESIEISVNLEYQDAINNGSFQVYFNDVLLDGGDGSPTYTTTISNITSSGMIRVVGTPENMSIEGEVNFEVIMAPTVTQQSLPVNLIDGINYTSPNSATLVIDAPEKEFIYVAGSFNSYTRDTNYLMKKDTSSDKFWLELTGLNSGEIYTYQYWVYDLDPATFSPSEVKTADPFSTLVLSPTDDITIPSNSYPNMPPYPLGQKQDVTVLQTDQTPYNWQVTNFNKPKEEDLIIYEVLVRDFDANRNFQTLIDRIDYFKNLNVNAIELMPVMEFEGNESWGYTTNFHMALDKFYGTSEKFKEFIDLCHQNGIAVILDIALDHAYSKNPMVRMWMKDTDDDGIGVPNSQNPYFNEVATHSYGIGSDFNHQQTRTQNYVQRVLKHWIEDYKIDGFRWELTKGFTQNCTVDESCTNSLQQDRIDILKQYADYAWSLDPDQYVIFEDLGNTAEEKQLADYRFNEGKGAIILGNMNTSYTQLSGGFASNAAIENMGHESRGFLGKRLLGYTENHNDERLMYNSITTGNSAVPDHNVQNLDIALSRMSAIGAASLTIPGPKMIRQFSELGMEDSVFTCSNGSINDITGNDGNCKEDTKPQPQWVNNWINDTDRRQIYDDWSRLIELKTNEAVFEGDYSIIPYANDARPRIYISNNSLPDTELKNVVIFCNFSVVELTVTSDFPYTGTWYDLMDDTGNSSINVTQTNMLVGLQGGTFKIYGNQPSQTLSNESFETSELAIFPNPVQESFKISTPVNNVKIIDITGKLVKEFNGHFSSNTSFDISNLSQSIYAVRITSSTGSQKTTKLIKL